MAYFDAYRVEFSDDRKTLVKCSSNYKGSYIIPQGVVTIGHEAFKDCVGLTEISFPPTVQKVGREAFNNCTGLLAVKIINLTAWCNISFYGSSSNPIYYAKHLYISGEELTTLKIPKDVKIINHETFCNCRSLRSIIIHDNVEKIGMCAFSGCDCCMYAYIPNNIKDIGKWAFDNVSNIVYNGSTNGFPWGARSVNGVVNGNLVFSDTSKKCLSACSANFEGEIIIPNGVTKIGDNAFACCDKITSVTIPNSVSLIGERAFSFCDKLKNISIPNTVIDIGNKAFFGCKKLDSITIPTGISIIRKGLFNFCNLSSIEIPPMVKEIEDFSLSHCLNLAHITFTNSDITINDCAFYRLKNIKEIIVPQGSKDKFKKIKALKEYRNLIIERGNHIFVCPQCGNKELPVDANFCPQCGKQLSNGPVASISDDANRLK